MKITKNSEVKVTRGEGDAKTTWVGTVVIAREDGTALVKWHTPMAAKSIDFPMADLTPATPACGCPDDCNCRSPWRTNYCGCKAHA